MRLQIGLSELLPERTVSASHLYRDLVFQDRFAVLLLTMYVRRSDVLILVTACPASSQGSQSDHDGANLSVFSICGPGR